MAFHSFYYETAALIFDMLAARRHLLQAREDEAGQSFEAFVLGKNYLVLAFEIANVDGSVQNYRGIGVDLGLRHGDVELVFQLADQLFEHVFHADYARCRTEFVDHHGEVTLAALEFDQQFKERFGFGDDQHIVHDLVDLHLGNAGGGGWDGGLRQTEAHPAHEIFGVKDADDVLGAARRVVDGDAGVLLVDDAGESLVEREVGGEREDAGARDHDLAGGDVVEFERVEQHLFLGGGDLAGAAGGADDEAKLVGRVHGAVADLAGAEGAEDESGGAAHERDERAGDGEEEIHGSGDGESHTFGALEGERLGDEFAEGDVQGGDEHEGDGNGNGVRVKSGVGDLANPAFDEAGEDRLAEPTEGQAGDGDAELNSVDDPGKLLVELENDAGADAAVFDELEDASFAHADEGEFGGRKEGIGRNQKQDDKHPQEHQCNHGWLILASPGIVWREPGCYIAIG